MHQHGACEPAGLVGIGESDVVGDDHHLDLQPERLGPFGSEPKVQPVTGVVLDHEQATRLPYDCQDRGEYGVHAG